ncbi:FMN-dependent dehydrogenase-domain-containing protein [Apiosordaria backusii]|uniref:FMN-dependent dehydrogenase-domain-containing protein n=1 Tax=Apiosordaria backusii TaxID=314023 RepID=A0AA40BJS2_9PEZI|nr:FMN-dependent dehydrogenase-domain-containing protein [Apiosordaria backusii]
MSRNIPPSELAQHNTLESLWLAVNGTVYDLATFAPSHPGGLQILLQNAGQDASSAYNKVHSPSLIQSVLPSSAHIGSLDSPPIAPAPTPVSSSPTKPPLSSLISPHDFPLAAIPYLSPKAVAFISSAATDCLTNQANNALYSQLTLRPRILVNVSKPISLSETILGCPVSSPIFVSPTSLGKIIHPQGEKAIALACSNLNIAQTISTSASFTLSEILSDQSTTHPAFLQLYVDKHRPNSERIIQQAVKNGVKAVMITVDAPVPGKREADERIPTTGNDQLAPMAGTTFAQDDSKGAALGRVMGNYIDSSFSWDDLPWIKSLLPPNVKLVLKGVQTAADAVKAKNTMIVDGIVISNHGGRSLDTSTATILVLLELQKCCPGVFDKMEVLIDGGVRRGTDVFKALCLGARGVGVGRGPLWALGGYGREGVERYLEILNDELVTTMKMCGVTSLEGLHPGLVNTRAVDHLIPNWEGEVHPYAQWRRKRRS